MFTDRKTKIGQRTVVQGEGNDTEVVPQGIRFRVLFNCSLQDRDGSFQLSPFEVQSTSKGECLRPGEGKRIVDVGRHRKLFHGFSGSGPIPVGPEVIYTGEAVQQSLGFGLIDPAGFHAQLVQFLSGPPGFILLHEIEELLESSTDEQRVGVDAFLEGFDGAGS